MGITAVFTSKSQVNCIYTDCSESFDKLAHSVILLKIKKTVFPKWFYRICLVILQLELEIASSSESSELSQGNHLGPLLFILSIDDISQVLHT